MYPKTSTSSHLTIFLFSATAAYNVCVHLDMKCSSLVFLLQTSIIFHLIASSILHNNIKFSSNKFRKRMHAFFIKR